MYVAHLLVLLVVGVGALTPAVVEEKLMTKSRTFLEDLARSQGPSFVETVYGHIESRIDGARHPSDLPVECLTIDLESVIHPTHFLPSWEWHRHATTTRAQLDELARWWPNIKARFEADGFRVGSFSLEKGGEDPDARIAIGVDRAYCAGRTGAILQQAGPGVGGPAYCARRPHLTLCWN